MNWIAAIFLTALALQVSGKQNHEENQLTRQNLSQRTVRLDPLLRRALLRALSELEREAQEKIEKEEIERLRSDIKAVGKRGNDDQESTPNLPNGEIQNTAGTSYPTPQPIANDQHNTGPTEEDVPTTTESAFSVTIKDTYVFHTPSPIELDGAQQTKSPEATLIPPDLETNLVSEVKIQESVSDTSVKPQEQPTVTSVSDKSVKEESKTSSKKDNEVELFKAPLVAAFTLHQDSKGTPHSVVSLIRTNNNDQARQNLLRQQQHQLALLQQQEQQLLQQRQQLIQHANQQQFIPSVTITPLSQPNTFTQQQNSFSQNSFSTSFPSSTPFPPLVSNSLLPQNFQSTPSFQSTIVPSQGFHVSSTTSPIRSTTTRGFVTTPSPPRSFPPQSFVSTLLPSSDFSVIPSRGFSISPTPQPIISSSSIAPQNLQSLNIPPVTLPLQNEPRFSFPPLSNQNQEFLDRQKRIEEQNRQRQLEEYNRLRFLEEQKRQRQIEEQNKQRLIEEENRLRQLEEERKKIAENQFRLQRQEQGVDFQRSVAFGFNRNQKPNFNPVPLINNNPFGFHIQPSQSFGNSLSFADVESRNRVNRQEAFGSTGNFGFNRPVNQIPQFQKDLDQRGFPHNQYQQFPPFPQPQQQPYRTIPEEHYRAFQGNRFHHNNQFQSNSFHFRPQPNHFLRPTHQPVTKQLENLLIQSGVAGGDAKQEDLNIVSKVLALNHERSDLSVAQTRVIERSERRAQEVPVGKELLVGETSESPVTTQLSPH